MLYQSKAIPRPEPKEPDSLSRAKDLIVPSVSKLEPKEKVGNRADYVRFDELHRISKSEVIELALKVNPTNLEVHILYTKEDSSSLIATVELTGMRGVSTEYNFRYQSYSIRAKKHNRGELSFRLIEPQVEDPCRIKFISNPKAGFYSVSIHLAKLEQDGTLKPHGATNRKISYVDIPRLPIHKDQLEDFKERLERESYRLEGLRDPDSISDYCSRIQDIFESWNESTNRERILKIRESANAILTNAGIPACFFPEREIATWKNFSPSSLSRFVSAEWSIHRSSNFVDQQDLISADKRKFLSDFYKTLVEVEQTWLQLRYLATNNPDLLDSLLSQSLSKKQQLPETIKMAQQFPLSENDKRFDYCKKLLFSYSSDPRSLFASASTGAPSLEFWEKINRFLGKPYLFHDLEAEKLAKQALKLYKHKL